MAIVTTSRAPYNTLLVLWKQVVSEVGSSIMVIVILLVFTHSMHLRPTWCPGLVEYVGATSFPDQVS